MSLEGNSAIAAVRTGNVTTEDTPENVACRWTVGLETAKTSLRVTTQQGVRSIPNPATRLFKTQMAHLRYPRLRGMFYANIIIITDLIIGLSPSRIFRQDKRVYPIMALPEFGERQFSNPNVPVYSCTCQVVPWLLSIESPFTGNMMLSVFAVVRPGCILPVPYA